MREETQQREGAREETTERKGPAQKAGTEGKTRSAGIRIPPRKPANLTEENTSNKGTKSSIAEGNKGKENF